MPPKRKASSRPSGRPKRPRPASPIHDDTLHRHGGHDDDHDHDAEGDVDADADGEAEAEPEAERQKDAEGVTQPKLETESVPDRPRRGRGRPRKTQSVTRTLPGATRSSPRKPQTQSQAQQQRSPSQDPVPASPTRGAARRPGRPKGRGKSTGRSTASAAPPAPTTETEDDVPTDESPNLHSARPLATTTAAQNQDQDQPPPPQPLHQPAPPGPPTHAPFVYPPYPSYLSHAPPPAYAYAYHPDGRPFLPLRPDAGGPTPPQGMYPSTPQTSFATTFSSYDGAPQGNPFPPFGAVYGVVPGNDEDDIENDDDEDVDGAIGANVGAVAVPRRKTSAPATGGGMAAGPGVKAGGRAGRGDHVACHFCRGRKLKCDGRRPTCGHCALRSLACAYDETIRRRGPGKKEKNAKRNPRNAPGAGPQHIPLPPHPQPGDSMMHAATAPTQALPTQAQTQKRRRRPAVPAAHVHAQTHAHSILRFDDPAAGGAGGDLRSGAGIKPASAAYGVESNERLGYFHHATHAQGGEYETGGGWYGQQREQTVGEGGAEQGGAENEGTSEGVGGGYETSYGEWAGQGASPGAPGLAQGVHGTVQVQSGV